MNQVYVQRTFKTVDGELRHGFAVHMYDPGDNRAADLGDGWRAVPGLASFEVDDGIFRDVVVASVNNTYRPHPVRPVLADEQKFTLWCAIGRCRPVR